MPSLGTDSSTDESKSKTPTKSPTSGKKRPPKEQIDLTGEKDAPEPQALKTIWDNHYCENCDELPGWECLWCGKKFKKKHHTRAVSHFAKKTGNGIAPCLALISKGFLEVYTDLFERGEIKIDSRKQASVEQRAFVEGRLDHSANVWG